MVIDVTLQKPNDWMRPGFVLKPDTDKSDWETLGGGRVQAEGIKRVPIRLVKTHRLRENPKGYLDSVSGSFVSRSALPTPGSGKLGLQ